MRHKTELRSHSPHPTASPSQPSGLIAKNHRRSAGRKPALDDLSHRTWTGRRDRTLLLVAIQTGLRVSELIGLCWKDVVLGSGAHVRCVGKGRKHRSTPLRRDAQTLLRLASAATCPT